MCWWKTHVRGFFDTDLHEVSWHFPTHEAVRLSGFKVQLTEWRSVSKKPFKMFFVVIPHLESKCSQLILSKLSRKSAICPRCSPWLLIHSVASSNELLDLHTTQTQASEVRRGACFSGHWMTTSIFAEVTPKSTSQRQLQKISNGRSSQLNQYLSYEPHANFKPTWIFFKILCVSFEWYFSQKKNLDVGTGAPQ